VDAVGLSILSGSHGTLVPRIIEQLKEQGAGDIPVFVGGIIPKEDIPALKAAGVLEIFTPGADTSRIADAITKAIDQD